MTRRAARRGLGFGEEAMVVEWTSSSVVATMSPPQKERREVFELFASPLVVELEAREKMEGWRTGSSRAANPDGKRRSPPPRSPGSLTRTVDEADCVALANQPKHLRIMTIVAEENNLNMNFDLITASYMTIPIFKDILHAPTSTKSISFFF